MTACSPTRASSPFLPARTNDVVVTLSSSNTGKVVVPPSVTILTGLTNATFNITIVDNALLDGTQIAAITAGADGYTPGIAPITVYDNETATLTVTVRPALRRATACSSSTGTVSVSTPPASDVAVSLTSGNLNKVLVTSTVMIPAGQTFAAFNLSIVDNNLIDGSPAVAITAHIQNWTDGVASIIVLDNENTNLTVSLPASAYEGDGVLVNAGSVSISGSLLSDLLVNLASAIPEGCCTADRDDSKWPDIRRVQCHDH